MLILKTSQSNNNKSNQFSSFQLNTVQVKKRWDVRGFKIQGQNSIEKDENHWDQMTLHKIDSKYMKEKTEENLKLLEWKGESWRKGETRWLEKWITDLDEKGERMRDLGLEVDREELSRGRVDLAQSGLAHCFFLHLQSIFDRNCNWLRATNQIDDCLERGSAFIEQCLAARLFADCVLAERHEIRLEVRNASAQLQCNWLLSGERFFISQTIKLSTKVYSGQRIWSPFGVILPSRWISLTLSGIVGSSSSKEVLRRATSTACMGSIWGTRRAAA